MGLGNLLGTLLGRSWGVTGGYGALLGRSRRACYSRPGMLQPPWHVTGPSSAIISSRQLCCTLLLVRSCVSLPRFRACLACLTLFLGVSFRCCIGCHLICRSQIEPGKSKKHTHSTPLLNGEIYRANFCWEERNLHNPLSLGGTVLEDSSRRASSGVPGVGGSGAGIR